MDRMEASQAVLPENPEARPSAPFGRCPMSEHGAFGSIAPAAEGGYKVVDGGSVVLVAAEGT